MSGSDEKENPTSAISTQGYLSDTQSVFVRLAEFKTPYDEEKDPASKIAEWLTPATTRFFGFKRKAPKTPIPAVSEEKRALLLHLRPQPSLTQREQKSAAAVNSPLLQYIERLKGQEAATCIQLEQQQERQQQQQQEQQLEHHQEQQQERQQEQQLEEMDSKDIYDYRKFLRSTTWISPYDRDSDKRLVGKHRYFLFDEKTRQARDLAVAAELKAARHLEVSGFDEEKETAKAKWEADFIWFNLTMQGLPFLNNLDGFSEDALDAIFENPNAFQEGIDINEGDVLPPGFFIRIAKVDRDPRNIQHILCYDSERPFHGNPLVLPVRKPVAATLFEYTQDPDKHRKNREAIPPHLLQGITLKEAASLEQFMEKAYCLSSTDPRTAHEISNGRCFCAGCCQQWPNKPKTVQEKKAVYETNKGIFYSHFSLINRLGLKQNAQIDYFHPNANLEQYAGHVAKEITAFLTTGEGNFGAYAAILTEACFRIKLPANHSLALEIGKLSYPALCILMQEIMGLELPPENSALAKPGITEQEQKAIQEKIDRYQEKWKGVTATQIENQIRTYLTDPKKANNFKKTIEKIVGKVLMPGIEPAFSRYQENLEDQHTAFFQAVWQCTPEHAYKKFPVLKKFTLPHLRLLLEITVKFDFGAEKKKRDPKALDALLAKFQEINDRDGGRSFDVLFNAVLKHSDSWLTSLFSDKKALSALNGICELNERDRSNWNWLLERHAEIYPYNDLGELWSLFQAFNTKYKELTDDSLMLDFTQIPQNSVKKMDYFLRWLLFIIEQADDKEEQLACFARGEISIRQIDVSQMAIYRYYLLIPEQERSVPQQTINDWQADIKRGNKFDPNRKIYSRFLIDYRPPSRHDISLQSSTNTTLLNCWRYLGTHKPRLKLNFYRRSLEKLKDPKMAGFYIKSQLFSLIIVTTTTQRAMRLQETSLKEEVFFNLLFADNFLKSEGVERKILNLLTLHIDEDFEALTLIEAATLLLLWKQEEFLGGENYIALVKKTKKHLQHRHYREPFLTVIRKVYARSLLANQTKTPTKPLLPLSLYLDYSERLLASFIEEELKKEDTKKSLGSWKAKTFKTYDFPEDDSDEESEDEKKPSPTQKPIVTLDKIFCEKIHYFVSRLSAPEEKEEEATSLDSWKYVLEKFKQLQAYSTNENVKISERLIFMLSELAPGSLPIEVLNNLLSAVVNRCQTNTPISDLELFALITQQDPVLKSMAYPKLPSKISSSNKINIFITQVLKKYPSISPDKYQELVTILKYLWKPEAREEEAEVFAQENALIQKDAELFLRNLLHKNKTYSPYSEHLIHFLSQQLSTHSTESAHYSIEAFNFSFLNKLLTSISRSPAFDPGWNLFKKMLKGSPDQCKELLKLQDAFFAAMDSIIALPNVNPADREKMVSLLHRYARQHFNSEILTLEALSTSLTRLVSAYPSAITPILTLLKAAEKQGLQCFCATLDALENLSKNTHLTEKEKILLIISLSGNKKNKGKKKEREDAKSEKLAEEEAKAHSASPLLSASTLARCNNGSFSPAFMKILIAQLGRKDNSRDIEQFLLILGQIETTQPQAFNLLKILSAHPPKLGIQKLLAALRDEQNNLLKAKDLKTALEHLELDPHGNVTTPKPFDSEKMTQKIAQVTEPSRHADGEDYCLFESQRQILLKMVETVHNFEIQPTFTKIALAGEEAKLVTALELTHAEIAAWMQEARSILSQEGVLEDVKQTILLQAISLLRQAMRRAPKNPLYANDTQILAVCNAMVRSTTDDCAIQVDTGQGKTLITAFNAACAWLLKGQGLVTTSDSGLLARDFSEVRPFFELLGIPIADNILTQDSRKEDLKKGAINYTTFAYLELFLDKIDLESDADFLIPEEWILLVDELDEAFLDSSIKFRFTIPQIKTDSEGHSPIAIYYMEMLHFLNSSAYQELLKDETATPEQAFGLFKDFLFSLSSPSREQQEKLKKLLTHNHYQLETWFASLYQIQEMHQGIQFALVKERRVVDGVWCYTETVCAYSNSGRPEKKSQFSNGVQQLLQAEEQRASGNTARLIPPESLVVFTSDTLSCFAKKWARRIGASATLGSPFEIAHRYRDFPLRVNRMPPEQTTQRIDNPPIECDTDEEVKAAIKKQVLDYLQDQTSGHHPILITVDYAADLPEIQAYVAEVLEENEIRGVKKQTLEENLTQEEEKEIVKKAGKQKTITFATRLAGRGFDIKFKEHEQSLSLRGILLAIPKNKRQQEQYLGRVGRRGEAGNTSIIVNKKKLITRESQKVDTLKDLYAANEHFAYHHYQLNRYLDAISTFRAPFLEIHRKIRALNDKKIEESWKIIYAQLLLKLQFEWKEQKTTHQLEQGWRRGCSEEERSAYQQRLKAAERALLKQAAIFWEQAREDLYDKLEEEQRRREQILAELKLSADRKKQQDFKEEESKTPQGPETAPIDFFEDFKRIKESIEQTPSVTEERLAASVPQQHNPYLYLPLPADGVDALSDATPKPSDTAPKPANQASSYQGIQVTLDTSATEEILSDSVHPALEEKSTPQPQDSALENAATASPLESMQDALSLLITKGYFGTQETPEDMKRALGSYLTNRSLSMLTINTVTLHPASNYTLATSSPGPLAAVLSLSSLTINYTLDGQAPTELSVYFNAVDKRRYPESSITLYQSQEVIKPIAKQKSYVNYSWLLFVLLCMGGGAAFSLTGLAATTLGSALGVSFFNLAYWELATSISILSLNQPGFWILASIGAATGLLLALLIFSLTKLPDLISFLRNKGEEDSLKEGVVFKEKGVSAHRLLASQERSTIKPVALLSAVSKKTPKKPPKTAR